MPRFISAPKSIELTSFSKKPAIDSPDSKHAPVTSPDQATTIAVVKLKDFKIDLQSILSKIRWPNIAATMARSDYARQSDAKKALPLSRFWKQPNTLLESCVQSIAGQLLQDSKMEVPKDIPDKLKDQIDQHLIAAGELINKEERQAFEQLLKPYALIRDIRI